MKQRAPRTATTRHVTEINRTAILDVLREHGPLSRRDIQQRTGLGSATIERLCSALIEEGAVEPAGQVRSSVGRPSTLLRFMDQKFLDLLDAGSLPAFRVVANLARVLAARLRAADDQLIELAAKQASEGAQEDDLDRLRRIFFTDWGL